MKAVCILYQRPNNIIREKKGKKALTMVEKTLTKELVESFPELTIGLRQGKLKMGQKIKMPDVQDSSNIERVVEYDMVSEFIFPNFGKGKMKAKELEDIWEKEHKKESENLDNKKDFQEQMKNNLRWFLSQGWRVTGYTGTHFTLELDIKEKN